MADEINMSIKETLRPGLMYQGTNNSELRYIDNNKIKQRLSPQATFNKSMCDSGIERGDVVEINGDKLTKADTANKCPIIGFAVQSYNNLDDNDPMHVQTSGLITIPLAKFEESETSSDGKNKIEDITSGKTVYATRDGKVTVDIDKAQREKTNIVIVGEVVDKDKSNTTINVHIENDERGALDSTQFQGVLGEAVEENELTVLAWSSSYGNEDRTFTIEYDESIDVGTYKFTDPNSYFMFVNSKNSVAVIFGQNADTVKSKFNQAFNVSNCFNELSKDSLLAAIDVVTLGVVDSPATVNEGKITGTIKDNLPYTGIYLIKSASLVLIKGSDPEDKSKVFNIRQSILNTGYAGPSNRLVKADLRFPERSNIAGIYYGPARDAGYEVVATYDGEIAVDGDAIVGDKLYLGPLGSVTKIFPSWDSKTVYLGSYTYKYENLVKAIFTAHVSSLVAGNISTDQVGMISISDIQAKNDPSEIPAIAYGYLLCDGVKEHSINDYPELYYFLKDNYGNVDSSKGNFKIPLSQVTINNANYYYKIKSVSTAEFDIHNSVLQTTKEFTFKGGEADPVDVSEITNILGGGTDLSSYDIKAYYSKDGISHLINPGFCTTTSGVYGFEWKLEKTINGLSLSFDTSNSKGVAYVSGEDVQLLTSDAKVNVVISRVKDFSKKFDITNAMKGLIKNDVGTAGDFAVSGNAVKNFVEQRPDQTALKIKQLNDNDNYIVNIDQDNGISTNLFEIGKNIKLNLDEGAKVTLVGKDALVKDSTGIILGNDNELLNLKGSTINIKNNAVKISTDNNKKIVDVLDESIKVTKDTDVSISKGFAKVTDNSFSVDSNILKIEKVISEEGEEIDSISIDATNGNIDLGSIHIKPNDITRGSNREGKDLRTPNDPESIPNIGEVNNLIDYTLSNNDNAEQKIYVENDGVVKTTYNAITDTNPNNVTFEYSKDGKEESYAPANISAGIISTTSQAKFKTVYGETNTYTEAIPEDVEKALTRGSNLYRETEFNKFGSFADAVREIPLAAWDYINEANDGKQGQKANVSILTDRIKQITEDDSYDIISNNANKAINHAENVFFTYKESTESPDEPLISIKDKVKNVIGLITDKGDNSQNLASTTGVLTKATQEIVDRVRALEVATFGPSEVGNTENWNGLASWGANKNSTRFGSNALIRKISNDIYGNENPTGAESPATSSAVAHTFIINSNNTLKAWLNQPSLEEESEYDFTSVLLKKNTDSIDGSYEIPAKSDGSIYAYKVLRTKLLDGEYKPVLKFNSAINYSSDKTAKALIFNGDGVINGVDFYFANVNGNNSTSDRNHVLLISGPKAIYNTNVTVENSTGTTKNSRIIFTNNPCNLINFKANAETSFFVAAANPNEDLANVEDRPTNKNYNSLESLHITGSSGSIVLNGDGANPPLKIGANRISTESNEFELSVATTSSGTILNKNGVTVGDSSSTATISSDQISVVNNSIKMSLSSGMAYFGPKESGPHLGISSSGFLMYGSGSSLSETNSTWHSTSSGFIFGSAGKCVNIRSDDSGTISIGDHNGNTLTTGTKIDEDGLRIIKSVFSEKTEIRNNSINLTNSSGLSSLEASAESFKIATKDENGSEISSTTLSDSFISTSIINSDKVVVSSTGFLIIPTAEPANKQPGMMWVE